MQMLSKSEDFPTDILTGEEKYGLLFTNRHELLKNKLPDIVIVPVSYNNHPSYGTRK